MVGAKNDHSVQLGPKATRHTNWKGDTYLLGLGLSCPPISAASSSSRLIVKLLCFRVWMFHSHGSGAMWQSRGVGSLLASLWWKEGWSTVHEEVLRSPFAVWYGLGYHTSSTLRLSPPVHSEYLWMLGSGHGSEAVSLSVMVGAALIRAVDGWPVAFKAPGTPS